jgi:hypothetical protein
MSNQEKAVFVNRNFHIQCFWGVMAKFCQIPDLCRKVVCPDFYFSRPVEILTTVTHKSLTVWNRIMDHRKVERVTYHNGIRDFQSFGQSGAQKLCPIQPLFCPGTEFSRDINSQNPVTSKLFVG